MAKKRRRQTQLTPSTSAGWKWLTFPVFAGVTFGASGIIIIQSLLGTLGQQVSFLVVMGMLSFTFAHIVTHFMRKIIVRQRMERMSRAQRQQAAGNRTSPPAQ